MKNRIFDLGGKPLALPAFKMKGKDHLKLVKLALPAPDVDVIKAVLRQTITATKLVMTQTAWPNKIRAQRQSEIEAMERVLTVIVEQEGT